MEETNLEVQESKDTAVCAKCGAPLGADQDFCPKCGTPRNAEPKKLVCSKCGAELQEGQAFCSKCGQKAGLVVDNNVASAIEQFNNGVAKENAKKKTTPIIVAVVVVIVILAALAFKTVAPKIFITVEGYLEQGNYEKAYEKAKTDDEKTEVIAENAAAVQSAFSADNLKDPSSFSLRDAYYWSSTNSDGDPIYRLVLYISGANSYGASVSSYWLYTWDSDDKEWSYWTSVSDLSEEEDNSWDDSDEKLEKALNNLARVMMKDAINDGTKISKDAVKRINGMFEEDTLDDVELLDVYDSSTESE